MIRDIDVSRTVSTDTHVSDAGGGTLLVVTGHTEAWSETALRKTSGYWDLSKYESVAMDVRNVGKTQVRVFLRIENPWVDGQKLTAVHGLSVEPGMTEHIVVPLTRKGPDIGLFGMKGYPYSSGEPFDPSCVMQLVLSVQGSTGDHLFQITGLQAVGDYKQPKPIDVKTFFPFIDKFGQYVHKEWPGKVHSVADLKKNAAAEKVELAAKPGPQDWDKWGGWKSGPTLRASGHFRVEKYSGKWWMVDPDGKLFFSNGIDCVGEMGSDRLDKRDKWYQDFPGKDTEVSEFLRNGRGGGSFSFASANLKRKYGANWKGDWATLGHRRLRSWGLNTIGNWSSSEIYSKRMTPYTVDLRYSSPRIAASSGMWGKFPDVFDPAFEAGLKKGMSSEAGRSGDDPWCIGYFVDNEMEWGDAHSFGLWSLQSPASQPSKKAFVEQLKGKYGGIEQLNAKWGTSYGSWNALLDSTDRPDEQKISDDLAAFCSLTSQQYFKTVKNVLKEFAPNKLYLGCRFSGKNKFTVAEAAKYCDVVSYNLYQKSVATFNPGEGLDVPLLVGEFHFGALDRGMFHTGLVPVADQKARAQAYKSYVTSALKNPLFVGCHWFQYQDEPTTGRSGDGENYQIGFIDVADTVYRETVDAAREVSYNMYNVRAGRN